MKTKKHHAFLLSEIIEKSGTPTRHTFLDNYLGNRHIRYPIRIPQLRQIAKKWVANHAELTQKEFQALLTSLTNASSSTEKTMAGLLLDYAPEELLKFNPQLYDKWLGHLEGWAEVDAMCYGHFSADQLLKHWPSWRRMITQLSSSKNINKRRASLVLLCKPLTQLNEERLSNLAFTTVDRLSAEKSILITKAISWLLRSMVKQYRTELNKYFDANAHVLPAIAVRETRHKLKTGKKN